MMEATCWGSPSVKERTGVVRTAFETQSTGEVLAATVFPGLKQEWISAHLLNVSDSTNSKKGIEVPKMDEWI